MTQPTMSAKIDTQRAADADGQLCLMSLIEGRSWIGRLGASARTVIGRSTDADLFLDHASISRAHAALHAPASGDGTGTIEIEDLGSRNGTTVRGERIRPRERVPLRVGDGLVLGTVPMMLARDASMPGASTERSPYFGGVAIERLLALVERVAQGNISVLVLGETGVGKEVLAEHVHQMSPRAKGPLVSLNCAALPESLLESELFGHERGAFTGATQAKAGILESANKGSVFLDEIGELALPLQAKLLRAIDQKQILRLGAVAPRPIDVRFITATNRSLIDEVAAGRFRQDLYYRVAGVSLNVPPLRERLDEIPELTRLFVARAASDLGRRAPTITSAALASLASKPWPGNVRELKNVIERAVLLSGAALEAEDLGLEDRPTIPEPPPSSSSGPVRLRGRLAEVERAEILGALERFAGNQTRAAEALGIPRATFVKRLDAYGVGRPRKR